MKIKFPERVELAALPTPIQKMDRLSKYLSGPDLYIKRDDLTGLATGGNKTRKLELLVADAIRQGCDHLVTMGTAQSNHCRQTAAAAARYGLGCSLVLSDQAPSQSLGNLLLDELLGAHIYWTNGRSRPETMEAVLGELRTMGRTPYPIPVGGSNVIGCAGYVLAMREYLQQAAAAQINNDFIILSSSSGGTQAGLVLGAELFGYGGHILGISAAHPADSLKTQVAALITATAAHLGLNTTALADKVDVNDDYVADGYAKIGEPEREAIQLTAQKEGILLDPVYTAKAMAGVIDLIRWGAFSRGQSILFWHTGGTASLSAFANRLVSH